MIKKLALYFILSTSCVYAEEVKMLDSIPSSEELMKMLRGKQVEQISNSEKTRGKEWGNEKVESRNFSPKIVGLPVQFKYNSDIIEEVSKGYVKRLGETIKKNSESRFLIEGHTDAKGSAHYNMMLSKKRAVSLKNYLVKNYQIPSKSIVTSGQGENKPLPKTAPYSDKNRRVQILLLD